MAVRETGEPLADQYLAWVEQSLTTWITSHPDEVIAGITSYTNDSPTSISNGCTVRTTTGRSDEFRSDQVKGVITLNPAAAVAPAAGGTGTYTVATSPGFVFTATSDDPSWLTATVAAGVVTWTAAANAATSARTATIRNAGTSGQAMIFTVTQDAAPLTR